MTLELCHCELSGDIHLIRDGKGCELCVPDNRQPMNADTVEFALKWYAEQLSEALKEDWDYWIENHKMPEFNKPMAGIVGSAQGEEE